MNQTCIFRLSLVLALLSGPALSTAPGTSLAAEELWRLRDYSSERISSYDADGANDDGNWQDKIESGDTRVISQVDGPGVIKHIWMTIASGEPYHLKKIVLRMYWDGEDTPSVEAPIGDFFGLGLGRYHLYESEFLSVGSQRALNASFPMPFRKSATITVTNEAPGATAAAASIRSATPGRPSLTTVTEIRSTAGTTGAPPGQSTAIMPGRRSSSTSPSGSPSNTATPITARTTTTPWLTGTRRNPTARSRRCRPSKTACPG